MMSAVYVVGLIACLVVGKNGPNVFDRSPPDVVETSSLNVTWYGKIDGMEPMHQVRDDMMGSSALGESCVPHLMPF